MDGHFVPNLTIGPPVVASLRRHSRLLLRLPPHDDRARATTSRPSPTPAPTAAPCTWRSATPRSWSPRCAASGLRAGLAANPDTPFEAVEPYLEQVDLVLCMTVFPGFGGQEFMAEVLDKVRPGARRRRRAAGWRVDLEVDGGIDADDRGAARPRRGPTSLWPAAPSSGTTRPGRRPRPSGRRPGRRPGRGVWPLEGRCSDGTTW